MRTLAFGLALAAIFVGPTAGAGAAFQDSFDGPDSESLPEPWVEYNEFPSGFIEAACFGASNLRVNGNAMAFVKEAGGCAPESAYYFGSSTAVNVPGLDLMAGPVMLTYDFVVPPAGFSYLVVLSANSGTEPCTLNSSVGAAGAPLACGPNTIAARITSLGAEPASTKPGADGRQRAVGLPSAQVAVEIGPVDAVMGFMGYFGGVSAAPVTAGSVVPFSWIVADGISVQAAFPGQEPLVVSTGGGCGGCKASAWSPKLLEVSGGMTLWVVDAAPGYSLYDLGGGGPVAASTAKFDNFVLSGFEAPPPLEPIAVRVAAKGKFKKQPINLKQKNGRVPMTVFGRADLSVYDINPGTVRMGASGNETTVGIADVTYTHVDKDGIIDAVFNFPKSAAATPCGTTSLTITGTYDGSGRVAAKRVAAAVPGGAQPFYGSDSVKTTGCSIATAR